MIVSKLKAESFYYYNLHSEEVITSNFIKDINLGIFCDRLQSITMERVVIDIKNNLESGAKIVFDFKNIEAIQPNLKTNFIELKSIGYKLAFRNITKEIVTDFGFDSLSNSNNRVSKIEFYEKGASKARSKEGYEVFYLYEDDLNFFPSDFKLEPIFRDHFQKSIKKYKELHDKKHTSSFIYLSSYINLKRFISEEKELCIYAIYRLAQKILKDWREKAPIPRYNPDNPIKELTPVLVCQSLNSSYIASVLSNLLKLDVLILDKIGPVNRLYNSLSKNIVENRNYIIVSDMVCLGTEVKIAKSIIEFLGGKCLGNVSLIKTETLKKKDIEKDKATVAIFSIDSENNRDLGYYIETNLENRTHE